MSTGIPCLRCGDFVVPETAPIPGIALCSSCLESDPPTSDAWLVLPPRELIFRQLWPIVLPALAGAIVGAILAFGQPLKEIAAMAGGVGLAVGFVASPFVFVLWGNAGYRGFKRVALERLGIAERADPRRFELVYGVDRNGIPAHAGEPGEIGLLALEEGGLVFLGLRGTRTVARISEIKSVRVERLRTTFPPRSALRVGYRDGHAFFAFLEATTFRANRARAEAALLLLRERTGTGA